MLTSIGVPLVHRPIIHKVPSRSMEGPGAMPPVVPHAPIPHGRRASNTSPPPQHDKHFTLGFLGGGMMASALIKGLLKAEVRAELLHCTVQRTCPGSSVVLHTHSGC